MECPRHAGVLLASVEEHAGSLFRVLPGLFREGFAREGVWIHLLRFISDRIPKSTHDSEIVRLPAQIDDRDLVYSTACQI
jgi:hypothetical protein